MSRQAGPLADDTILRGYKLVHKETLADEVVYFGSRDAKLYLVRESPSANSSRLAWECALLQRLSHSQLPEYVDYFEENGFIYLVTRYWLTTLKDCSFKPEPLVMRWGTQLLQLLAYLGEAQVHIDLNPDKIVSLDGGQVRLLDLRHCERSPGHPNHRPDPYPSRTDQMGLGRCLSQWLGEPLPSTISPIARALLESITGGESPSGVQVLPPDPVSGEPGRVPISDDSSRTCLAPGSKLGGYEVQFFAEGGMSVCYLGRADHDVRFLKEVELRDKNQVNALRREYEFLRVLKHPSIVSCYHVFQQGGYLYLVMDYVEGTSLEALSTRPDYLAPPEKQLLTWALALCDVLGYLHACNPPIIYRDLKPGNIILTNQGQLRLIDFGIARTYKSGNEKDTEALGTVTTASPEHFYGQTSNRSDIYSLGATLFLLACPSYRPNIPFTWAPLREINTQYSPEFSQLLSSCLQPEAEQRWTDAGALATAIRGQLEALGSSAVTTGLLLQKIQVVDIRTIIEEVRQITDLSTHVAAYTRRLVTRLKRSGAQTSQTLRDFSIECEIRCLGRVFATVAEQLERGTTPATAFGFFPSVFPAGYLDLLGKAQSASALAVALDKAAEYLETEETRSRAPSTMTPSEPVATQSVEPGRRRHYRAFAGLALASGTVTTLRLYSLDSPWRTALSVGAAVAASVGVVAVAIAAFRDTRRMRVQNKAQNLLEEAWTSYAKGQTEKAAKELGQALITARDNLGPSHLTTLSSLHSLANLYRQKQDYGTAETYYLQAVQIYRSVLPDSHPARGQLHYDRALNCVGIQDISLAFQELDRSLHVWQANRETHPRELSEVLFYKGRLHFDNKDDAQALDLLSESLEIQYEHLGSKSSLVYATMSYLTKTYVRLGRLKESEPHLVRLIQEIELGREPDYATLAEANLDMGRLRLEEQRVREAESYFLRCLQLLQTYVGPNEWLIERALKGLRAIYPREDYQSGVVLFLLALMREKNRVRPLLEQNPQLMHARDNTGWGPLQWAVFLGREDILLLLLQKGADPGYDPARGLGPVHVACAWNRPGPLKLLLDSGLDINSKGLTGWTPLFWCAFTGQQKLMEILIDRGANVRHRDDHGRTILHLATIRKHLNMVVSLISAGADVNSVDNILGSTPLHMAAERGQLAICGCLVFNGANLTLKDKAGRTALDLAVKNQHKLVARELRRLSRQLKVPQGLFSRS